MPGGLTAAAQTLGLALDARQAQALQALVEQMLKWNKTYNLTALRTPEQIQVHHVLDSLSVLRPIQSFWADRAPDAGNAENTVQVPIKLVDVGSGAGLPGVVLAVMQPDWQVFCVDAVEKKTAFVRHLRGVLDLPNLHVVHGRIEKLPAYDADLVVSRAFSSLPDFVRLAGRHAAAHGCLLAMKGAVPQDEIRALAQTQTQMQNGWQATHVQALHVPHLEARRCLVWIHRQEHA